MKFSIPLSRKFDSDFRLTACWFTTSIACSGQIVVESVGAGFPAVLDTTIYDPCFGLYYTQLYLQGRVIAIANIHTADSDRLVRLVNDILDLERLDSGKVSLLIIGIVFLSNDYTGVTLIKTIKKSNT